MNVKKFTTKQYHTNCYLLENEGAAIIIDPGEIDDEIIEFAKENNHKKEKAILLTHCHFDHICGVGAVNEIFKGKIIISKIEEKGLNDENINVSRYLGIKIAKIPVDITVKDGDKLDFGGKTIEVISTPGHTAGSVCYKMDNKLFSGDTLFRLCIGRCDLPTASPEDILISLKKLKALQGDFDVFPGHGELTTLEFERQNNRYLKD